MTDYMQGDPDRENQAVPFSDDDKEVDKPEDILADAPPTATPEERIDRKKKQEERVKRLLDAGKQSKEEAKALREEQQQLKQELAELRARVNQPPPPPQAASGKDPWEEALDKVYEKQNDAYMAAQAEIKAGTWNADRSKHYEKIAREVETEKTRIILDRGMAARSQQQRAESAQQIWVNKYPEVYNNPRAYQFAEATFNRKKSLLEPGQTVTADMIDEVMNEAMQQFRLGPKRAPTASEKSKLSGIAASGGGGGSSRSDGIQMTPELKRMAVAAYSELPEAEAIKKWVNGTGKRLREKKLL